MGVIVLRSLASGGYPALSFVRSWDPDDAFGRTFELPTDRQLNNTITQIHIMPPRINLRAVSFEQLLPCSRPAVRSHPLYALPLLSYDYSHFVPTLTYNLQAQSPTSHDQHRTTPILHNSNLREEGQEQCTTRLTEDRHKSLTTRIRCFRLHHAPRRHHQVPQQARRGLI